MHLGKRKKIRETEKYIYKYRERKRERCKQVLWSIFSLFPLLPFLFFYYFSSVSPSSRPPFYLQASSTNQALGVGKTCWKTKRLNSFKESRIQDLLFTNQEDMALVGSTNRTTYYKSKMLNVPNLIQICFGSVISLITY